MRKTDDAKLITVGQLVKELEKYEEKRWDWNVEIATEAVVSGEDAPTCIISGMSLDKEGDLRIDIEGVWGDGGDYYVGELIEHLRDFDSSTKVYLAGGGLLFSIDSHGGIFAGTEDDDDSLSCYATPFGEYDYKPSGWFTVTEQREREDVARKKAREERIDYILLALMALVTFLGLCYNAYALVVHSTRHVVWENVCGVILCVFLLIICGGTLLYSKDNK